MRLLGYNILNGAEGRADPVAEVIEAQRADIVALVEADDVDVLERIARRLRMDYIRSEGDKHSAALLSRWPITKSINHVALGAGPQSLLQVTIAAPDATEWDIGVVHLSPGAAEADETRREGQVADVLKAFASLRDVARPHLLAGDLNSISPAQRINPDLLRPKARAAWDQNGGSFPRRVLQRLFDAGYADTCADPTLATGTFSTQYPAQRVDYCLGYRIARDRIRSAWTERDRLAKYASDHFPIGVEIA
jgi:endonuclease/exonuclease/phosphatase family metal-dependent hydrolase